MIKYILFLFTPFLVYAQTYMAKIEPYEQFTIYSQTSGQIIKLDKKDETKVVSKELIKLDSSLEKNQLKIYENQLSLYTKKLEILETNYEKYKQIRGKSQSDKDEKFYEVLELKISIDSIKLSITDLKDTIAKKTIKVNNLYIKEFAVNQGDYVSIGAELATAYDISKSKLVVYVSSDDYQNIQNKKVLINGEENIAKIEKVDKTLDETFVSAHKVTLTLDNNTYGKVMNVEFKK